MMEILAWDIVIYSPSGIGNHLNIILGFGKFSK
jgi:hypothetical protein